MVKKLLLMHDKVNFPKSVLIIRLICLEKFQEGKDFEVLTNKINNLVNDLIKESFIYSSRVRLRKNIIECLYYKKEEKNKKNEDIIENDDLNTSHENLNAKNGTKVRYKKEKIYCTYFLGNKQINKMKKHIHKILEEKIINKAINNIYKLLFDNKYYLTNLTSQKGTDTHYKIEKMFYI